MNFTFNPRAIRVKKAKFRRMFAGKLQLLWRMALIGLLICAVVAQISGQSAAALLLLAPALLLIMLLAWNEWELKTLPASGVADAGGTVALEQVLSADVLARLSSGETPQSLWNKLQSSWQWRFIGMRLTLDPQAIGQLLSDQEQDMERVWEYALKLARHYQLPAVTAGTVTASLLLNMPGAETYLAQRKLTAEDVLNVFEWQVRLDKVLNKLQQKRYFGGLARDWAAGYTPLLNQYGQNLSTEIERGGYQHLYLQTHRAVVDHVITTLAQPHNNSVALIGETGTGKTSLVYALAERLLSPSTTGSGSGGGEARSLQYHKIIALNSSLLVSESKRHGNLEGMVLHILAEAKRAGNIILFLDDAQGFLADETGAVNLTNILLPVLQNARVRLIMALTPQQWQRLSVQSPDLAAALQYQAVNEPDETTVLQVLQDQALAVESQSRITMTYQAIQEAHRLADRYVSDQAFPGKGISLLRSSANYAQGGWVTPQVVQTAVESTLGVKVSEAGGAEKEQLLNLEDRLHERMINQTYAVKVVADALRRARAGVRNLNRPVGSFLFLGPTGVGKTELSKALADAYFGGADRIIRIDMSEYNQPQSVERLLAPSGQTGSFLTALRQQPFSVVLLDEVEKASGEVLNLLLQMLDEGRLTDTAGRSISFKDAIVIATSNAGADTIRQQIEAGQSLEDFSSEFIDQLISSNQFKPELINRFDEVVLFRPLTPEELKQVVGLLLQEVNKTLTTQRISVELTPAATDKIVQDGYDPRLGARPMRRMVQRTVESVVAKRVLAGALNPGDHAVLDVGDLESE